MATKKGNTVIRETHETVEIRASNCDATIIVDREDYELKVKPHTWCIDSCGYPATNIRQENGKFTLLKLHHHIFRRPAQGMQLDHKNLNKMDARKNNLRECSPMQNVANRGIQKNNTLLYKGVIKIGNRYIAKAGGVYLGCYETTIEAARAYNRGAIEKYGEFARLNEV